MSEIVESLDFKRGSIFEAITASKYETLIHYIGELSVRDKRYLFSIIRNCEQDINIHAFFPKYGLTVGEFATGQTLLETVRKVKKNTK